MNVPPDSLLFFRLKSEDYPKALELQKEMNSLLEKGGNMLLIAPTKLIKEPDGGFIYIIPCFFGFPWLLFPLSLIGRGAYTLAILLRSWSLSVRLKPCSARRAAAAFYGVSV